MEPPTSSNQIRVLKSRAEIEALRDFWNSCQPSRDADLDFFLFIVDLFPDALRPHVVAIYRNDSLQILLLGRLEETPLTFKIGYFRFRNRPIRLLTFIHGGILGNLTDSDAKLLVQSLRSSLQAGEAEMAFFSSLDVAGPLFAHASAAAGRLVSCFVSRTPHYSRRLDRRQNTFIETLTSNGRYNHKRRKRKLFEAHQGKIKITCFSDPGEIERLIRDAEVVAKKSYQRGLRVGFSNTPQTRKRLEFELAHGWLRGYILYVEDAPAAFWIGSLYRGTFYSEYLCYDPAHAKLAPGMYLIIEVLEVLFSLPEQERVTKVDFGGGGMEYKANLSDHNVREAMVPIFSSSVRGQLLRLAWIAAAAINMSGKLALQQVGILRRFKRNWRHLSSSSQGDKT